MSARLLLRLIMLPAITASTATPSSSSLLAPRRYMPTPLGATLPTRGWMLSQLEAQGDGLCGRGWLSAPQDPEQRHFPAHAQDSIWVNPQGSGEHGLDESWPYWANGATPLAVLLNDTERLSTLSANVDYILTQQASATNNGWLGPLTSGGAPWSAFRAMNVLAQWAEGTNDTARIVKALATFAQRLLASLKERPLDHSWNGARWQEGVAGFEWLLDHGNTLTLSAADEVVVVEVIALLAKQGIDWDRWLATDEANPWLKPTPPSPPKPFKPYKHCTGTAKECTAVAVCYQGCCAAKQLGWCYKTPCCPSKTDGDWNCTDLPPYQCNDNTGNACADNCTKAIIGSSRPQHQQQQQQQQQQIGGLKVPVGFAPWFPNNTRDADNIANNIWESYGMSQMLTHGVNIGMAMQNWGLMYRATNDTSWIKRGRQAWDKMLAMHGQATGGFSGDEGISGLSPDRGTETCTVVETMNSASEMFLTTGSVFYADIAEKVALNALPGAFLNGTMWSLNYFQQVNKLDALDSCANTTHCASNKKIWSPALSSWGMPSTFQFMLTCAISRQTRQSPALSPRGMPSTFQFMLTCTITVTSYIKGVYCYGLVYECCVGNHAQGWPKFAARQLAFVPPQPPPRDPALGAPNVEGAAGIAVVYYFSSRTEKLLLEDGNVVSMAVQTDYPFGNGTIAITILSAQKGFPLSLRIPSWSKTSTVTVNGNTVSGCSNDGGDGDGDVGNGALLTPGSMAVVEVPFGRVTNIVLQLDLAIRIERRPPYVLEKHTVVDTNAANIFRGPLLYALPLGFVLDNLKPYDDGVGLLPAGQAHGQNNFLLGSGPWSFALIIANDSNVSADLQYRPARTPLPPAGQGVFAAALVPGAIWAKAKKLNSGRDASDWKKIQPGDYLNSRGAAYTCPQSGGATSQYTSAWAGPAPKSPVPAGCRGGGATETVDLMLLPYGATDLRIAEFPTTLPCE